MPDECLYYFHEMKMAYLASSSIRLAICGYSSSADLHNNVLLGSYQRTRLWYNSFFYVLDSVGDNIDEDARIRER